MSHDCAICISEIGDKNKVVTDCGHTFHASCLIEHVVHNGYGCPYCRNIMVHKDENDSSNVVDHDSNISENQPSIDYIIEHIHRCCYSYEDLVRIICITSSIQYKNYTRDMYLTHALYDDIKNAFEMYVDNGSDSELDITGLYEIDSV